VSREKDPSCTNSSSSSESSDSMPSSGGAGVAASDYLGPAHALCRARMEVLAAERDLLQRRLAVYAELPDVADKDWPCTCLKKVDRNGQKVKRAKTPSCPVHGVEQMPRPADPKQPDSEAKKRGDQ
jgi:hypothetical protein